MSIEEGPPIIVGCLNPSEVAEKDRNKIIISVIFKLKPGATNKKDES